MYSNMNMLKKINNHIMINSLTSQHFLHLQPPPLFTQTFEMHCLLSLHHFPAVFLGFDEKVKMYNGVNAYSYQLIKKIKRMS